MGWKEGGWEGEELTPPQVTAGQKEFQGLNAAGLVTPQLTPKKGATGSHHSQGLGWLCLSPFPRRVGVGAGAPSQEGTEQPREEGGKAPSLVPSQGIY